MAETAASHQGRAYSSEKAERLLLAALTELLVPGMAFRDLSVDQLRAHTGMARSTFYRYFADRSELLQTLSASALKQLYAGQRAWLSKGADVTRDDVRAGMRTTIETYLENEPLMRAVAESSVYDPAIREAYESGVRDYGRAVERFIRRGQRDGRIGDLHAEGTATALVWMVERNISQLGAAPTARRVGIVAGSLADVVWAALFGSTAR